jgi:hypothetical protein
MRPYIELADLSEFVLEESYVLGVLARPGEVVFEIDFVLTQRHPAYMSPPPSEVECYRKGRLLFTDVEQLLWDDQGAPPATDASGESDYEHIDSFEWDQTRYAMSGDWGRMELTARSVQAQLDDSM